MPLPQVHSRPAYLSPACRPPSSGARALTSPAMGSRRQTRVTDGHEDTRGKAWLSLDLKISIWQNQRSNRHFITRTTYWITESAPVFVCQYNILWNAITANFHQLSWSKNRLLVEWKFAHSLAAWQSRIHYTVSHLYLSAAKKTNQKYSFFSQSNSVILIPGRVGDVPHKQSFYYRNTSNSWRRTIWTL